MMSAKQEIVELGTRLIKDDAMRDNFLQATEMLKSKRASTGLFFELLHEFGHMSNGYEVGAIPIYIKVEKHLFVFTDNTIRYQKSSGFSSSTLLYFDSDDDLSSRWIKAVRGGMEFTTEARKIKTFSIRGRLFNRANALGAKTQNKGYDYQLLKTLRSESEARNFNEKAKRITETFVKTGLV